jgi:hypothetical protein
VWVFLSFVPLGLLNAKGAIVERILAVRPIQLAAGAVSLYRKPYARAHCVRAAGDFSTVTMIK